MNTILEVQRKIDAMLQALGCRRYSAERLRNDCRECWTEIRADSLARGEATDQPFFDFVLTENVGVFVFYGPNVDLYFIRGNESDLREYFDHMAMVDVEFAQNALREQSGKEAPDITMNSQLSKQWLA